MPLVCSFLEDLQGIQIFNSDNFVANVSGTYLYNISGSLKMNIGQFAQMIGENNSDQIKAFQIHQLVLQT